MNVCNIHPNMLFCDSNLWEKNVEFRDSFVENLKNHLKMILSLNIGITWTDTFLNIFWKYSPWISDHFYMHYLMDWIYQTIESTRIDLDSPQNDICNIDPPLILDFEDPESEIRDEWLILIHRMIHKFRNGNIIYHGDNTKIYSLSCICKDSVCLDYLVINNPQKWYDSLNYLDFWPIDEEDFVRQFELMIDICYHKELRNAHFRRKIFDIVYDEQFMNDIICIKDNTEKRLILSSVTKRICKDIGEAGRDGGLQEERIRGNLFRFRVSRGARIHHELDDGEMRIIGYYLPSSHK